MNKIITGLFALALAGMSFVMADEGMSQPAAKDLKKIIEEGPYVETSQKGIKLSGYVDAGYQYNFNGGADNNNTSYRFDNAAGTAGDSKNRGDFDLNAVKLALEKPLSDANELQAGFRMDVMMGEDAAALGTNAGNTSDSIFIEQGYVQFRLPYGNGMDFKVGKFVTILGYEVIERPINMNITYGNIFQNEIPLWHTGFLASYQINDVVDVKFGVANGWNNDNGIGAGTAIDDAAILAAVNIVPVSNLNWYNAVIYGINGGAAIGATDDSPSVVYDTYINWKPKGCKDKLLLGVNFNLGHVPIATSIAAMNNDNYSTWWGWAAYVKYQFNDIFSLANRFDYIHNDDGSAFGNTSVPSRQDIWSETITASFDVIENVLLRAEYRLDWGKDYMTTASSALPVAAPGGTTDGPLHTAAVEIVYSF